MRSFVTEAGDHSLQDVLSRLRFLASLKPGEKIDVATHSVQTPGFFGQVYRTLFARGESREATLAYVRATLGEAYDLVERFEAAARPARPAGGTPPCGTPPGGLPGAPPGAREAESFDARMARLLRGQLTATRAGIEALATTYSDDRMFASRVGTLVSTLDTWLAGSGP